MKKVLVRAVAVLVGLGVAVVAVPAIARSIPQWGVFESASSTTSTHIINAITREEQVVLLSLGIQGITEASDRSSLFGVDVPGSGRTTFLQYGFRAKLGFDASDVRIDKVSESHLRVRVPAFIFIGHSDETFKLVAENNGALSWVTPEIDTVKMITTILDDDAQQEYISSNREILEDQARSFYEGVVRAIAPDIRLDVTFA